MKILIVDDELVSREKMKKIMSSYGECQAVENGSDALEIFKTALDQKEPFELLTIDISMPDIDGTEVLFSVRKLENDFLIPKPNQSKTIMVTSSSDKDTIITCIQAGCNEYIVKPFDKGVINKKLAKLGLCDEEKEEEDRNSVRNFVMQTVSSFKNGAIELPVLSHVVKEIQGEMNKPNTGIDNIAKLIEKDAVISMKLIATANSPVYRGADKINSVATAIPRLGLKETQDIVSTIATKSLYKTKDKNCKELMEKLWMHSLACACCAKIISTVIKYDEKEKIFLMALLHDIGKVLILNTIGSSVGKEVFFDRIEIVDSIQEVHTSFGAALLDTWGFERGFSNVAIRHDWKKYKPETGKEILIVNLANNLVRYLGYTIFENDDIDLSDIDSAKHLEIDQDQINTILAGTKETISKLPGNLI